MNKLKLRLLAAAVAALPLITVAQEKITITETSNTGVQPPTLVSLSGFSGEVLSTLQFDLYAMGFKVVSESEAQYLVSGSNASRVEARVKDKVGGGATLLARAYSNGSLRQQAHALADEVVKATVNREGIAQTKIAFRVKTGPRAFEIYVADYDGQNAKAVTTDDVLVAAPTWVKGQSALFYTTYKNTFPNVVSHNLTTGKRQIFASYPGANLSPTVSPDGKKVAMILSRGGSPDVWVSDVDGQNLKQLTKTRESESSPTWSPDSRTICFTSEAGGGTSLYTVTTDGGAMKKVPIPGRLTEPDWSPDGKWIAFTRQNGNNFSILVASPNGTGVQELGIAGEDPTWGRNSRTLIYTSNQTRLSVLDVPTRQSKDIARAPGSSSAAAWAR